MATIKNNRENSFQFNATVDGELKTFTIEGGTKKGEEFTAGHGEVDDAVLLSLEKNAVVASWFESGALELLEPPKPAKQSKADKEA